MLPSMKKSTFLTRKEKVAAATVAVILTVVTNLIPFDPTPTGELGKSAVNHGLPFTIFSTSTASYPAAPPTSEFYMWGLVANITIMCVIVTLVAYSIHLLKNRTEKS